MSRTRKIFIFIAIPLVIVFAIVGVVILKNTSGGSSSDSSSPSSGGSVTTASNKDPWGGTCHIKESGRKELTFSPMDPKDIQVVSPMGLTAGGHVTPIDHMYFYPNPTPGDRFSAKVYAVADGVLTSIGHRGDQVDGPADLSPGMDEFRLTIEQTCNQGYYYDLITKLAPKFKEAAGTLEKYETKNTDITVKAGELIGYVGNQSLDFGVYDTEVTLGFIVPEHYIAEPWKIHTADAFSYFTAESLASFESKITRFAQPRSGKIDYDKDGYLIGNWFAKGTNGYAGAGGGTGGGSYWEGHLALLYDAYDPNLIIISVGVFKGDDPQAFAVVGNQPDPGTITKESGLVKYELTNWTYLLPGGGLWDRQTPTEGIVGQAGSDVKGVALMQLTDTRTLKFEVFPGKTAAEVSAFTDKAKTYER